jgi:hypothetical protein
MSARTSTSCAGWCTLSAGTVALTARSARRSRPTLRQWSLIKFVAII